MTIEIDLDGCARQQHTKMFWALAGIILKRPWQLLLIYAVLAELFVATQALAQQESSAQTRGVNVKKSR